MIVSVVLNTEYMDIASRTKWYLKNLLHCKDNGWILITHEYMKTHIEELQKDVTPSLFESWEIRPFTMDELKDVEQYFIPDAIFEDLEKACGSRSEMLSRLFSSHEDALYPEFTRIFSDITERHQGDSIEAILHILEPFESLKQAAKDFNSRLINFSFSAIRKPHGYRLTLFNVSDKVYWGGAESKERCEKYLNEGPNDIPIFTNEEIIALIGKERTLPLIRLMDADPQYEMGVCCECYSMLPSVFKNYRYTDDDIFYSCKKHFGSKNIKVRSHSLHLDDLQVDRTVVHNDPASTILSCKRSTAVQSQILLKVLMWKRSTVLVNDTLSFSFLCNKDFTSLQIADIRKLNYYIFAYLVPAGLLFDGDYWKWRLTNPTETEIYQKHLEFIFRTLGIPIRVINMPEGKERFRALLNSRNCDEQLVHNLVDSDVVPQINWDVATSRFDVVAANGKKSYWRLDTLNEDGSLTTVLDVNNEGAKQIDFYPLDDVAGFARLQNVEINGKCIDFNDGFKYMPKMTGKYVIPLEVFDSHLHIICNWSYRKIEEHLKTECV